MYHANCKMSSICSGNATEARQGKAPKVQLSFIKTAEFYPYLSDIVLTSPLGVPQCHCSCFGLWDVHFQWLQQSQVMHSQWRCNQHSPNEQCKAHGDAKPTSWAWAKDHSFRWHAAQSQWDAPLRQSAAWKWSPLHVLPRARHWQSGPAQNKLNNTKYWIYHIYISIYRSAFIVARSNK